MHDLHHPHRPTNHPGRASQRTLYPFPGKRSTEACSPRESTLSCFQPRVFEDLGFLLGFSLGDCNLLAFLACVGFGCFKGFGVFFVLWNRLFRLRRNSLTSRFSLGFGWSSLFSLYFIFEDPSFFLLTFCCALFAISVFCTNCFPSSLSFNAFLSVSSFSFSFISSHDFLGT